jgi:hypothetical protein
MKLTRVACLEGLSVMGKASRRKKTISGDKFITPFGNPANHFAKIK